ncbi:hypothetical protein [Streptomyces griseus]|uniref:hypothetical protein n=1 Tax=Streptomyces griseus TaxID=1911 RepID=UPI0036A2EE62
MKVRNTITPKRLVSPVLGVAAAGALTWLALAGAPASASAHRAAVADELPGHAVEDFNYPGAEKVLEEQGIVLKRGDGHIVLADCTSGTGLLELSARDQGRICFRVTGNSGFLTMEIPAVNGVKGNDYTTEVDMTVDGKETSFDIAKNAWTPVGETTDPEGRDYVLLEIRTTK